MTIPLSGDGGCSRLAAGRRLDFCRLAPRKARPAFWGKARKNSHFLGKLSKTSRHKAQKATQFHKNATFAHTTKFHVALNSIVARIAPGGRIFAAN